jgi:hypothetical protein
MELRAEVQIASMIKAMKDVIIPALDRGNQLAGEQAGLVVGLLGLLARQLPLQFRYDRDELLRLQAAAGRLLNDLPASGLSAADPALQRLADERQAAAATLQRCVGEPAELLESIHRLRAVLGELMDAVAAGTDEAAYRHVQQAILALSKEQLLRERVLLIMQGWEPDPAALPQIESLLSVLP